MNKDMFKELLVTKLASTLGKSLEEATAYDIYVALSSLVKDAITKDWVQTNMVRRKRKTKQVYYFSLEFLMGKMLSKNLARLHMTEIAKRGLKELGFDINEIVALEPDAGLGNGGLGRLAACFLDSLAACGFAGHGNGIRYKHGLFKQKISNGYQIEEADSWLTQENVWEIKKSSESVEVKFYGDVREDYRDGKMYYLHEGYEPVLAVPYDMPVMGYENGVVNTLRLWSAQPKDKDFDFQSFSKGQYASAVAHRQSVRAISDVLYPDDSNYDNKLLRLKQQYFFVCAGLKSIIRSYLENGGDILNLASHVSIHINDTHPALAVPELMRILVDEKQIEWDIAWNITAKVISYTNHTLLPEALEKWPLDMYKKLLPRIYQITQEIDRRFKMDVEAMYGDKGVQLERMAVISSDRVNMANLSIIGSHSVNGVAAVHSELLKTVLFKDFYTIYPKRFNNKTNGITHRRWLLESNPGLVKLLDKSIGDGYRKNPLELSKIVKKSLHKDAAFLTELGKVKANNKIALANIVEDRLSIAVDTNSIFDVQVKRMHAYKRQLLKTLHMIYLYLQLRDNPGLDIHPVTFIFGGKAAPGYAYAKLIIKLINSVADLVNGDPVISRKIKVVFLENYNVSLAEIIFPGSDISEQISTASTEASGTGNMKFMMNGAITVGTMDGANIEIAEAVGPDNIITFGLSVDEVLGYRKSGSYNSRAIYENNPVLKRVLNCLTDGTFKNSLSDEFMPIFNALIQNDEYFVLQDFDSYIEACNGANDLYKNDFNKWLSISAVNIGQSGIFSSDETIKRYANEIWNI